MIWSLGLPNSRVSSLREADRYATRLIGLEAKEKLIDSAIGQPLPG